MELTYYDPEFIPYWTPFDWDGRSAVSVDMMSYPPYFDLETGGRPRVNDVCSNCTTTPSCASKDVQHTAQLFLDLNEILQYNSPHHV